MDQFVLRMESCIEIHQLLDPGDGVVVGFSGGPDSTALLVALADLRNRWRLRLTAAHLDHGLRGDASAGDARFAADMAQKLGVQFALERVDVSQLARQNGTSIEAAGRTARYRFFSRLAHETGSRRIAVGHHRDDQIENVLWRFITGSGSDGLAGMRPEQGAIIRPLLAIPQKEIFSFLNRRQVSFRVDATNEETQFFRNRLRHELLPLLRGQYNRRIDDAVWRTSMLLAEEAAYLDSAAETVVQQAALDLPGGTWYRASTLAQAPVALRRRALRRIVWSLVDVDDVIRLTEAHVTDLESVAAGDMQAVSLPKGIHVEYQQGNLQFRRQTSADSEPQAAGHTGTESALPVPGAAEVWPPWAEVRCQLLPAGRVTRELLLEPGHAYLDFAAINRPATLNIRRWRPGDRMHPLGAPGSRKLQDLFVDRRVPRSLRHKLPIVTCGTEVLWVVGVAVADKARVGPRTDEILHIWIDGDPHFPLLR